MAGQQEIKTPAAPVPAGPYSQGLRAGDFIYTAGIVALDPRTGRLAGDDIETQTTRVLESLKAVLEAGGAGLSDVIKTTVHLADLSLFARFNAVYAEAFPEPRPVRTTVGSALGMGALVEIDVVAYVGGRQS